MSAASFLGCAWRRWVHATSFNNINPTGLDAAKRHQIHDAIITIPEPLALFGIGFEIGIPAKVFDQRLILVPACNHDAQIDVFRRAAAR